MRLKWGQTEYKGLLVSVDSYMNIQLSNTEEFIDGESTGSLGQVLIRLVLFFFSFFLTYPLLGREDADGWLCRCNNVLWISAAKGVEKDDVKMEG